MFATQCQLLGLFRICLLALCLFATSNVYALDMTPPGNRHAKQPPVPSGSYRRTDQLNSTFEVKYNRIYNLLKTDTALRNKIAAVSRQYGIDPVHIAGSLVGEHTYNVDALDRLQTYYVKAAAYLKSDLRFGYKNLSLAELLSRPAFQECDSAKTDAGRWSCRETVFEANYRGRTVDGLAFPDQRFAVVFFQPYYAGQTFGLGQLSPLTALSVSDVVNRTSGYKELDPANAAEVYAAIMDPDKTLAYMAAVISTSIKAYRDIARFDISRNPGVVATLYNVGNPAGRAAALARENRQRATSRQAPRLPEENYYGWLVNEKEAQLRALFGSAAARP
ncbi:DUF1402 family protein [Aureimonas fodinaquatilis]|uniref:DUF1402 family protein n=1 Tax=Aureimonas fodinaquatilis TaxID=2565783 RepID=A0A5B0DPS4_9HYPH|nr:DUF1402 family protein [Aureimonas fodinaquatilis]KAA0968448.1 DUF1402 family protein [Aureimonas fodinaquatilis]